MSVSRRKVSQLCKIDIDELHEKLSRVARAVGIVLFFWDDVDEHVEPRVGWIA